MYSTVLRKCKLQPEILRCCITVTQAIEPHNFRKRCLLTMILAASNVRINGKYTTYMDFNDEKQPLPAYVTRKGSELYSIRAFHQMHCVVSLDTEEPYIHGY